MFNEGKVSKVGQLKTYRLLIYVPGEDLYFPTNHTAADVDTLWKVAATEVFRGCRTQIVDEAGVVVSEPPVRSLIFDPTAPEPMIRQLWLPGGCGVAYDPTSPPVDESE